MRFQLRQDPKADSIQPRVNPRRAWNTSDDRCLIIERS